MSEKAFLYGVNPRRPIKNLNDEVPIIRTNTSLFLTKEEVQKCLPFASVWRRFNTSTLERVTADNIDRLHNEKFYTEEEWKIAEKEKLGENRGKVEDKKPEPVVEEVKEEVTDTVAATEEQTTGETESVADSTPDITIDQAPSEAEESGTAVDTEGNDLNLTGESIEVSDIPQNENAAVEESDANDSSDDDSENSADESSNIDVNSYNGKKKKHKH